MILITTNTLPKTQIDSMFEDIPPLTAKEFSEIKCLHDGFKPDQAVSISCSCKKCSVRC